AADDHAWEKVIVLAQRDAAHQRNVVLETRTATDANVGPDYAEGADLDVGVDLGPRVNRYVFGDVACHNSRSASLSPRNSVEHPCSASEGVNLFLSADRSRRTGGGLR